MRYVIKLHNENLSLGEPAWTKVKSEIRRMLVPPRIKYEEYNSQFHSSVVYFFTYNDSYGDRLFKMAEQLANEYSVRIVVATLNVKEDK